MTLYVRPLTIEEQEIAYRHHIMRMRNRRPQVTDRGNAFITEDWFVPERRLDQVLLRIEMVYLAHFGDMAPNDVEQILARSTRFELFRDAMKVATIAQRLGTSQKNVRKWIRRFNAGGLTDLDDDDRSGRPARLGPEVVREIRDNYFAGPRIVGVDRDNWTIETFHEFITEVKGVTIGRTRLAEIMNQADQDYQDFSPRRRPR